MTSPRTAAAAVFIVAVMGGTLADRRTALAPPRVDGYWILAADFHVHSLFDIALVPSEVRREAERQRLDVITITSHNQVFAGRLARWMAQGSEGPIVLVGEELTAPRYHLIASGIERTVSWDQPAAGAIADIHAQGGVAIAAHPTRGWWAGWDDDALAALDGVEAAHPAIYEGFGAELEAFYRRARAANPGIAPIGSSDFHFMPRVGVCRTLVLARERTASGVLEAVREGRTVAMDRDGNLTGNPDLVGLVQAHARFEEADSVWRHLTLGMAWVGLLGMVVCRPRK